MHFPQFYTATILNWQLLLADNAIKEIILRSFGFITEKDRCKIYAFVIMPNHIHVLWQIHEAWTREKFQLSFMKFTAQQFKFYLMDNKPEGLNAYLVNAIDREYQFWERNPLSIDIFSREVFEQKLNYIHKNPYRGKWNLANSNETYFYSSENFYLNGISDFAFLTHYMELFE